jgi:hypothetical protein
MPGFREPLPQTTEETTPITDNLPISAIVRAVCQAASSGPELLYEVMLKLSLMVEATAPTWALDLDAPRRAAPSSEMD